MNSERNRKALFKRLAMFLPILGLLLLTAQATLADNPTIVYFADFAHGGTDSPFATTFQLFNPSPTDAPTTISFFQDDGTPFNVGLKDVVSGNVLSPTSPGVFNVTVPARGLAVLITNGSLPLQSGWVMVTSTGSSLNGNAFFEQTDSLGNILAQVSVPSSNFLGTFTGLLEKSATVDTGVALANPSPTSSITVTIQATASDGTVLGSNQVTLGPQQHFAKFIEQIAGFESLGNTLGTLAFSSSGNVLALLLRQDHQQLSWVPLFSGTALAPTLTNLNPSSGQAYTTMTITGVNFNSADPSANQVSFGGTAAQVLGATGTTLIVTVPKGLSLTSPVNVTVTANGGTSNALPFTEIGGFPTPTITSLNPNSAVVNSSSASITINGTNFVANVEGPSVKFGTGGNPAVNVINSTQAIMTLTADLLTQVGSFNVIFQNPGGLFGQNMSSNPVPFAVTSQNPSTAPTITSIVPPSARVNERVTINGTNFDPTSAANNIVKFNGVTATVFSVSQTQIQVNVPANATTGPVTVTSNGITSNGFPFTVLGILKLQTVQVGTTPMRVMFDATADQAVVTNQDSNSVTFVDVANAIPIKDLQTGGVSPFGIAQYNRLAFVANNIPPNFPVSSRFISVVNLDTQSPQSTITVSGLGGSPFSVAVDPVSGNLVVTDNVQHIGLVNLVTQQLTQVFIETPYDVAIYNPSTSTDYAVMSDYTEGKLIIYDLQAQVIKAQIKVGNIPQGVAVNPQTGIAVVVNSGDNKVSVVDLNKLAVVATVPTGLRPNFVAIDSSRNRAVVSNNGEGTVTVIDLNTNTVLTTLSTGGNNPTGVAISEAADVAIVCNSQSGNVGLVPLP